MCSTHFGRRRDIHIFRIQETKKPKCLFSYKIFIDNPTFNCFLPELSLRKLMRTKTMWSIWRSWRIGSRSRSDATSTRTSIANGNNIIWTIPNNCRGRWVSSHVEISVFTIHNLAYEWTLIKCSMVLAESAGSANHMCKFTLAFWRKTFIPRSPSCWGLANWTEKWSDSNAQLYAFHILPEWALYEWQRFDHYFFNFLVWVEVDCRSIHISNVYTVDDANIRLKFRTSPGWRDLYDDNYFHLHRLFSVRKYLWMVCERLTRACQDRKFANIHHSNELLFAKSSFSLQVYWMQMSVEMRIPF